MRGRGQGWEGAGWDRGGGCRLQCLSPRLGTHPAPDLSPGKSPSNRWGKVSDRAWPRLDTPARPEDSETPAHLATPERFQHG